VTGQHVGLVFSSCDSDVMNRHLTLISEQIRPGAHAVLILDQAGWHRSVELHVPPNLTLFHLPAYSPELNPVERLWLWLKDRHLSHRLFDSVDEVISAGATAWRSLDVDRVKSVCAVSWLGLFGLPPRRPE
jgi:hypothetical protein